MTRGRSSEPGNCRAIYWPKALSFGVFWRCARVPGQRGCRLRRVNRIGWGLDGNQVIGSKANDPAGERGGASTAGRLCPFTRPVIAASVRADAGPGTTLFRQHSDGLLAPRVYLVPGCARLDHQLAVFFPHHAQGVTDSFFRPFSSHSHRPQGLRARGQREACPLGPPAAWWLASRPSGTTGVSPGIQCLGFGTSRRPARKWISS